MTNSLVDTAAIPGWGIDADPENDPTYPIRRIENQQSRGLSWDRPVQQQPDVEILRSIEHVRLPAVLGTSTPPSGLSGVIRRRAFRRSESDWWHWLMLMGADRINVVEGVMQDLARGKIPNIPAEMGRRPGRRHERPRASGGLAKKVGVGLAAATMLAAAGGVMLWGRRARSTGPLQRAADPLRLARSVG